jgi:DNA-binding transcriptional MerR regulator
MYTIGDFSRLVQVPIRTLRYYDTIGLLRPERVEHSTGYRYYAAAQVEQLNRVLVFKDLGFSLREIVALLADNVPLEQIRPLLRLKRAELERRVLGETARLARITAQLDQFDRGVLPEMQEVAVRRVAPRLVASVREKIASHDECERLFEELDRHAGKKRKKGPRGAVWHACAARTIDCEVFEFLPSPLESSDRVHVYATPSHSVASLVYRGSKDFLPAYRAIRAWITATGAGVIGPKREIFLEDGAREDDSVTEIQFPINVSTRTPVTRSYEEGRATHG